MNCRDLRRIMPELVEGELDGRTAMLAEEHIASCPACAVERAAYADALGALSRPRPMMEMPAALDTLELPERRQGWTWLRPALGTAALAAIMAGIILMAQQAHEPATPKLTVRRESTTPAETAKAKATMYHAKPVAAKPATPPTKVRSRSTHPVTVAAVRQSGPAPKKSLYTGREVELVHIPIWAALSTEPAKKSISNRGYVAEAREVDKVTPGLPEESVVVVACDINEQPEIWFDSEAKASVETQSEPALVHIESTDPSTGSVKVYDYSRDDQGREQVIEILSRT